MDIEPIMDEVRDKCLKWFSYNEQNYHHTGRIEQGIAMVVNMVVRDVEAQVTLEISTWMYEELNRRMGRGEFTSLVDDEPDPKVTYAKEMETEYVQAAHALHESIVGREMNRKPTYFESALLGVLDILHKRIKNVEGGEEE